VRQTAPEAYVWSLRMEGFGGPSPLPRSRNASTAYVGLAIAHQGKETEAQAMIDSLSNPSAYVPPAAVVVE
jgi:hypothetical protein